MRLFVCLRLLYAHPTLWKCLLALGLASAVAVGTSACAVIKTERPAHKEVAWIALSRLTTRCVVSVISDNGDGSTPGLQICISADTATRSMQGFLGARITVSEPEATGLAALFIQHVRALAALPDSTRTTRGASFTVVISSDTYPEYRGVLPNRGITTALLNGIKEEVQRDRVPLRREVKKNLLAALEYNVQWMTTGER